MEPFRLQPQLPASAVKTYQILAPVPTHFRPARCEEVDCSLSRNGFKIQVDETTDLGQAQAHYLRKESGRECIVSREAELTVFTFPPGTQCFNPHQFPLNREPRYLVRGGDWRGDPRGDPVREHDRPEDWVDDFATHQQRIKDRIERG